MHRWDAKLCVGGQKITEAGCYLLWVQLGWFVIVTKLTDDP